MTIATVPVLVVDELYEESYVDAFNFVDQSLDINGSPIEPNLSELYSWQRYRSSDQGEEPDITPLSAGGETSLVDFVVDPYVSNFDYDDYEYQQQF